VKHFHRGTGESGSAHVLDRDDSTRVHGFDAGFQKKLFDEGSPT